MRSTCFGSMDESRRATPIKCLVTAPFAANPSSNDLYLHKTNFDKNRARFVMVRSRVPIAVERARSFALPL
jgi:hypothetical protein